MLPGVEATDIVAVKAEEVNQDLLFVQEFEGFLAEVHFAEDEDIPDVFDGKVPGLLLRFNA